MHRFYHVGLTLPAGLDTRVDLQWLPRVCDDWMRYASQCWVLWSGLSAQDIAHEIRQFYGENEHFIVFPIDALTAPQGWAPQWVWEWINRSRPNSLPPLTEYPGVLAAPEPRGAIGRIRRPVNE